MGRLAMLVYAPPSGLTLIPLGEVSSLLSKYSGSGSFPTLDFPRLDFRLPYPPGGLRRVLPGRLTVDQTTLHSVAEI